MLRFKLGRSELLLVSPLLERDIYIICTFQTYPPPTHPFPYRRSRTYHPPGYDSKGKRNPPDGEVQTSNPLPTAKPPAPPPPPPPPAPPASTAFPPGGDGDESESESESESGSENGGTDNATSTHHAPGEGEGGGDSGGGREGRGGGRSECDAGGGEGGKKDEGVEKQPESSSSPVVYGALGQVEEQPVYDLPKEWKTLVSTLCLRTTFEPAELADLFQRFRQLAGKSTSSEVK